MDKQELQRISKEVEKENTVFANKALLDNLTLPSKIIGRENKAKELVRLLLGYKRGLVVPFVSVFGRSGSGKSTIVKFVCENLDEEIQCAFVNLRKAKTIFGCANLILGELGQPSLKSAQGINIAIEKISDAIKIVLKEKEENKKETKKKLFVLVLDEFDVLFYDKRGKPSDFIYKLLVMEEKLREEGFLMCTISISNNVMTDYEIDDRVRSRIGASEVYFEPYTPQVILAILQDRSVKAFSEPIDFVVLQYCAILSSGEHGEARRAIDLLRLAAEIAAKKGEKFSKKHVDAASDRLQKDRVSVMLSSAPYNLKLTAVALARVTYLTQEMWHSTSALYNQYRHIIRQDSNKPPTYRRIAELLTQLQNMGLVVSQTSSKGRHGYGTQYKLMVPPEAIGKVCFPDWWNSIVQRKKEHEANQELSSVFIAAPSTATKKRFSSSSRPHSEFQGEFFNNLNNDSWKDFVGS
ncbi:MAG: AAA family ATPase [Thermoproteota archaeon]|nr:AAA family ATPase [Thermoproteota archaeon]